MNKFNFVGTLAKDVKLETTQTGKEMVKNTIALNDGVDANGNKITQFIDFVIYGSQASYLSKYAIKGSKVALVGKVVQNKYQDKNNVMHYGYSFFANETEIISNPQIKVETPNKQTQQQQQAPEGQYVPNSQDFINDDDLPF